MGAKKLLWVKTDAMLPLDKGGKIRSFNMLKHIAGKAAVDYVCFASGALGPDDRERLTRMFHAFHEVPPADPDRVNWKYLVNLMLAHAVGKPFTLYNYHSKQMAGKIEELCRCNIYDALICDFLGPALNFAPAARKKAVLFQHNVEHVLWERQAHQASLRGRVVERDGPRVRQRREETGSVVEPQFERRDRIIPYRGAWLEFKYDLSETILAYVHRRKNFPATQILRIMGLSSSEDMQKLLGDDFERMKGTLEKDTTNNKEEALLDFYRKGDERGLDDYSARALARVWKGQRFSWWMTTLLHQFPDASPYDRHMQSIELAYLFSSRAALISLAEIYVGLPF